MKIGRICKHFFRIQSKESHRIHSKAIPVAKIFTGYYFLYYNFIGYIPLTISSIKTLIGYSFRHSGYQNSAGPDTKHHRIQYSKFTAS